MGCAIQEARDLRGLHWTAQSGRSSQDAKQKTAVGSRLGGCSRSRGASACQHVMGSAARVKLVFSAAPPTVLPR
ncbi:unnamed protein product [Caenorhabditis auriculariae]|uniref:Uncharacterized protein n=1 Tax=Caenorhabditis auriculariae TaxID=2777116 RepID=A0A8S1GU85_9PELO|nr:unnamed protein product [Caenorhabditis auriculariae]